MWGPLSSLKHLGPSRSSHTQHWLTFLCLGEDQSHPADSLVVLPISRALGFPRLPHQLLSRMLCWPLPHWKGEFPGGWTLSEHLEPGQAGKEAGPSSAGLSRQSPGGGFCFHVSSPFASVAGERSLLESRLQESPYLTPPRRPATHVPLPPSAHPIPHGFRSEGCEEMQRPGRSGVQRRSRQIPRRRCLLSVSIQRCTAGPGNGGYTGKRKKRHPDGKRSKTILRWHGSMYTKS